MLRSAPLSALFILALATSSLVVTALHTHECVHDKLEHEVKFIDIPHETDSEGRLLQTWAPIRIVFEFSTLTAPDAFRTYIEQNILNPTQNYLQAALTVKPINAKLTAQNNNQICSNTVTVPANYNSPGVDADLVVFVTATNEPSQGFLAYASSCLFDATTRRPVFGRLNYNLDKIAATTSEAAIERDIVTTLHEVTHILAFSSGLYQYYINPDTNALLTGHTSTQTVNGVSVTVLNVEPLTTRLRDYYGCNTLTGAYLENQGGAASAGSHWERRLLMNEFMTASISKEAKISELTLALLQSSGWYEADFTMAEGITHGKGKGCTFLNNYCMSGGAPAFEEFCSPLTKLQCTWTYRGVGACSGSLTTVSTDNTLAANWNYWSNNSVVRDAFSDNCPLVQMLNSLDCEDPANAATMTLKGEETYGHGSSCFMGTIYPRGALNSRYGFCLARTCEPVGGGYRIRIAIGANVVYCNSAGSITVPDHGGVLECPNPNTFCERVLAEGYCRRKCSGRGACTNNECVCTPGWGFHDCSKKVYTDTSCARCVGDGQNPLESSCYGDGCGCNPTNNTCMCELGLRTGNQCIPGYVEPVNNNTDTSNIDGNALDFLKNPLANTPANIGVIVGIALGATLVIGAGIYCGVKYGSSLFGSETAPSKIVPFDRIHPTTESVADMRTFSQMPARRNPDTIF